jgi:uncharacterized membrane protein YheB (UPF0754 family)
MRKVYFVLSLCLLSGCGAENPTIQDVSQEQPKMDNQGSAAQQELKKKQDAVALQYREAIIKHQEKIKPIAQYIAKVCRPKNDKKYISCMNEKKDEMIANSLFPDLETKMFDKLSEFEQQLIKKKITRKVFMEQLEKLGREFSNEVNERATKDIKAGTYTGKI